MNFKRVYIYENFTNKKYFYLDNRGKLSEIYWTFKILEQAVKVSYYLALSLSLKGVHSFLCITTKNVHLRWRSYDGSFTTRDRTGSFFFRAINSHYRPHREDIEEQGYSTSIGFLEPPVNTRSNIGSRRNSRLLSAPLRFKV